jgi:hypothetical protein
MADQLTVRTLNSQAPQTSTTAPQRSALTSPALSLVPQARTVQVDGESRGAVAFREGKGGLLRVADRPPIDAHDFP